MAKATEQGSKRGGIKKVKGAGLLIGFGRNVWNSE
jgi:hypothetical protein